MKNKEFREIQVSSSGLVFIFLAVLVLGVFIFLLGISVGKKQAQIAGPTTLIAQKGVETVTQQAPVVQKEPIPETGAPSETQTSTPAEIRSQDANPPGEEPDATAPIKESAKPVPAPKTTAASGDGKYFVQVGAFFEKSQATAHAAKFKAQGYPSLVLDPLPSDKKTVYRVRLGGYASRDLASQALAKLNAAAGKRTGYYVTKG